MRSNTPCYVHRDTYNMADKRYALYMNKEWLHIYKVDWDKSTLIFQYIRLETL
ncbi:hypothetical protein VCRA217O166_250035 [Vibrio crassostreae]|nr:hypothetical protein VCHA41O245_130036 [Vibrio chagasii]CAK1914407.1 hypothetical protein VCRA2119O245_230035 [Vibrio crassostreae]CAK2781383.1 hypothetical protein VCRA217O134_10058 [Vibrio crassostreae]CAK3832233.1 hypothetical protein VCRA217O166_250035 [Vibrio crassostreae]